jgi:uncharacterized membrane protein YgdD (TMEM256/DUF423 family)
MRILLSVEGIAGATAVMAGAFGSHALKGQLSPDALAIWQTGVFYHLTHAIVLLIIAFGTAGLEERVRFIAGIMFALGIILFSGPLYLLSLTSIRALGMITPVGGVLLIAGWITIASAALRSTSR